MILIEHCHMTQMSDTLWTICAWQTDAPTGFKKFTFKSTKFSVRWTGISSSSLEWLQFSYTSFMYLFLVWSDHLMHCLCPNYTHSLCVVISCWNVFLVRIVSPPTKTDSTLLTWLCDLLSHKAAHCYLYVSFHDQFNIICLFYLEMKHTVWCWSPCATYPNQTTF